MRLLIFCFALGCTPSGDSKPSTKTPAKAPKAGNTASTVVAPKGPNPAAAKALYDEAIKAQLGGDALASQDLMLRLAADHPETRHGRAARSSMGGGTGAIMGIGVLAAVAIPAFMKYIKRSKTSEVPMRLQQMVSGAMSYHAEHGKLPPTAARTPIRPACRFGDSQAHFMTAGDWAAPGWQGLKFQIEGKSWFQYEFISNETGFTARAFGDLDCNGLFSTFERAGQIQATGGLDMPSGMFIQNELE